MRVASIKVVMKTIAEERKVVTITPARTRRSGVAPATSGQLIHNKRSDQSSGESKYRAAPFMRAKEHQRRHGSHRCAIRNTEQVWFSQRIPQQSLISRARRGQTSSNQAGKENSRQADVEQDCVLL